MLTIGLLMIIGGVYVLNQGGQFLYPIARATGLISYAQSQMVIVPSTLLTVAPSNYTFLTADLRNGVQTTGKLQVEGGSQIGFYVMNMDNFSEWRRGYPTVIELARPDAINYNFTFLPHSNGRYYFIFSNQDPIRKNVVFILNAIEVVPVVSPFILYGGYEALVLGVLLSIIAMKTGRKREPSRISDGSNCRFCGKRIGSAETFCSYCGRSQT